MAEAYTPLPVAFGGGLNLVDSPRSMQPGEASVLENWRHSGAGRLTTRKAARALAAGVTGEIVAIAPYTHVAGAGGVVLAWDGAAKVVRLYTVDGDGAGPVDRGALAGWTNVAVRPRVHVAELARVLFIVDEAKSFGLTCYDPNDVLGSGAPFFQPEFDFNADYDPPAGTRGVLRARLVVEHLNHLFVFGYGDESDEDHPEIGRFSYLGLAADPGGSGDAGCDLNGNAIVPGSAGLFDYEDALPFAPRGTPVVMALSANAGLVVATPYRAALIAGSDRDSWRSYPFDGDRGAVNGNAGVVANGIPYWMSPLGPCRYTGGSLPDDLSRRIGPRLAEMNLSTLFAVHQPEEHQVRWYYALKSDADPTPNRWIGWDYREEKFVEDTLGYRVAVGGFVRPSGAEGPYAAPTNLAHDRITQTSARVVWTNGDTSPSVKTRVYHAPDVAGAPGPWTLLAEVDSGTDAWPLSGLAADTLYWSKVEHVRNAQTSPAAQVRFRTLAPTVVAVPTRFQAEDSPVWSEKYQRYFASVLVTWSLGQNDVYTDIHRSTEPGVVPPTPLYSTFSLNETYFRDNTVQAGVTYYYTARHRDEAGQVSNPTEERQATPTKPPGGKVPK